MARAHNPITATPPAAEAGPTLAVRRQRWTHDPLSTNTRDLALVECTLGETRAVAAIYVAEAHAHRFVRWARTQPSACAGCGQPLQAHQMQREDA